MTNIQRLSANGNRNQRLFASTIIDLMHSQGFYGRLYNAVNELSDDGYEDLFDTLEQQTFNDSGDVILWLEC